MFRSSTPKPERDARVDVLRGIALLMIFIDHVPGNDLAWLTLHDFGFSDAAEVFVLLAGFSAQMAYARRFETEGFGGGAWRIAARCLRIYATQALLLLATLAIVSGWRRGFGLTPLSVAPLLDAGLTGIWQGLLLHALPDYLDILPLYIVLLAAFPLFHYGMRTSRVGTLATSLLLWATAQTWASVDLPKWLDDTGWYFDPFSWQLLLVLGAGAAMIVQANGALPRRRWAIASAALYLLLAFVQSAPYRHWGLPILRPLDMPSPDKSRLAPLRVLHILALFYLVLTSAAALRAAFGGVAAVRGVRPPFAAGVRGRLHAGAGRAADHAHAGL